jgi:hypothetical protein
MKRLTALCALSVCAAHAATPCDFKGLSVGDKANPEQIMKHFGIEKYTTADPPQTEAEREATSKAFLKRSEQVSMTNALQEAEWREGPACREHSCRITYGRVTVGESPYPIPVGVFVAFDATHKITAIDVSYDRGQWDEVLELLNTKYGDNWRKEETQDVTTDYETKKSQPDTLTVLTHRSPGTNPATGDKCTINTESRDFVWLHTTPPIYRAELEIRLVSKNF